MTQRFTRVQAKKASRELAKLLPEAKRLGDVMDIHNKETGEYEYSFFPISFNQFMTYLDSEDEIQDMIDFCHYVVMQIQSDRQDF